MGSDFGVSSPAIQSQSAVATTASTSTLPFYFTASGAESPVPGKLRWVTTYIARFDPDINWPLDLNFELHINQVRLRKHISNAMFLLVFLYCIHTM